MADTIGGILLQSLDIFLRMCSSLVFDRVYATSKFDVF